MPITFTRKGRHKLFRDGVLLSEHNVLEEAYENAFEDAETDGNATYLIQPANVEFRVPVTTILSRGGAGGGVPLPIPDTTPPSDVTGPAAVAVSTTQINVTSDVATDAESGVVGYHIQRAPDVAGSPGTFADVAANTPLPNYPDTGLTASTKYHYRLKGINGAGLESSNWSSTVFATTDAVPGGGGAWQLAAGHWIPAKMPPVIIHPRPDGERDAFERCGRAPSGIEWRIPIVVQGGAWPFHYEITAAGGSGAVIGADYGDTDYGIIKIVNPAVGAYSLSVRVTDQDGTIVTRDWTLNVIDRENTTYFLFVNAAAGAGGNGSYTTPFNGIDDWYGADRQNATYVGRQCFYYNGTYTFPDLAWNTNGTGAKIDFKTGKPVVHIAVVGQSPVWDLESEAMLDINGGGVLSGIAFCGIEIINFRHFVTSAAFYRKSAIHLSGQTARTLFFEGTYDGGGLTSSQDGSNSAPIMYKQTAGAARHSYCAVVNNEFYRCTDTDTVLCYDVTNMVYEGNRITGGMTLVANGGWGVYLKGSGTGLDQESITIRNNVGIEGTITRPLCRIDASGDPTNVEVCWNSWKSTNQYTPTNQGHYGNGYVTIGNWSPNEGGHVYGNIWCYRNSANIPHESPWNVSTGTFLFQNDVWQHDGQISGGWAPSNCTSVITDASVRSNMLVGTSGILNSTTNLLEAAYSAYLGTHGAEVA